MEGNEPPRTQCIIPTPKAKIVAHNNINNIHEQLNKHMWAHIEHIVVHVTQYPVNSPPASPKP